MPLYAPSAGLAEAPVDGTIYGRKNATWVAIPGVLPVTAGLVLHLDASQLSFADGATVTTWPDLSVTGNNATNVGTPKLRINVLNGKPVVRFTSATSDGFNITTPISGADPWTVFAVMKGVDALGMLGAAASTSGRTPYLMEWYGNIIMTSRDTYTQVGDYSGAFHIITGSSPGGGVSSIFIDGTDMGVVTSAYGPYTGNFETIGYRGYSSPVYPDGDIAEILIYNVTVSGTNRASVEVYLGNKWGL